MAVPTPASRLLQEGIFSMRVSRSLDRVAVTFDDDHSVGDAGLLLVASLSERLGLESLIDETVDLGDREGAYRPGRKTLTVAHAMAGGAGFIDDVDVLRSGDTASVLGHRVMAPSTVGTFLRAFSFGHVRQLDRVNELALGRAWATGAGPGDGPVTVDVDSTVIETYGYAKAGAAFGYTRRRGYHPLLATRVETGEVLHEYSDPIRTPVPIHSGQHSDGIRTAFRANPDAGVMGGSTAAFG